MKELKKLFVIFLIFTLLPINILSLGQKEKLLEDYELALVDADLVLDELNTYLDTHSSSLSADIDIDFMIEMFEAFYDKDIDRLVAEIESKFGEESAIVLDLKLLKPDIKELYDNHLPLIKDMFRFIRDNQSSLSVKEFESTIYSSLDVSLKVITLLDKLNFILLNSSLGDIDFVELMEAEFSLEIENINNEVNDFILDLEIKLVNNLDSIKNDTITNTLKLEKYVDLINYLESIRTNGLERSSLARNQVITSSSLRIIDEYEELFDFEITRSIIIAKKYLIDNMPLSFLDDSFTDEKLEEILLPVYAPILGSNNFLILNNQTRQLTSSKLITNTNQVSDIIIPNYGNISYTGLISGRVATGTRLFVNNGNENVLEYTFVIKGDILGRGITDTTDLFRLIDAALGTRTISGIYRNAADMNSDTKIDISDIISIIDRILSN